MGVSKVQSYYRWSAVCDESRTYGVDLNEIPRRIVGDDEVAVNKIVNGDFETGNFSGWTVVSDSGYPVISLNIDGREAYLSDGGGNLAAYTTSIAQTVDVSATNPETLSMNYRIQAGTMNSDWMNVTIEGTEIVRWVTGTMGNQTFTYDLSDYAGETVEIKIGVNVGYEPGTIYYNHFFVDNISVQLDI
ncbi:hypothetical protein [Gudongella sp. DL1XJH-153]|uniref:hypothetical protein n=1 Tax=Gudongella sp. DL1XJH-153 TaxID=3409804 RepID=UPI003BB785C2